MRVGEQRDPRRDIGDRRCDRLGTGEYGALAGAFDRFGVGRLEAGDRGTGRDRAADQIGGALIERAALIRPVALADART